MVKYKMKYVKSHTFATLDVKKSKFITHICPYQDLQTILNQLQLEHQKARHFVYAYRYLNEFNQIVENCSDDNEPKNTAGKPSLSVLQGEDLINTAIVTIRYFGGIKLGVGGLIRAYTQSVQDSITQSIFYNYTPSISLSFNVDYGHLAKVEFLLKQYNIDILKQEFNTEILFCIKVSNILIDTIKLKLKEIDYHIEKTILIKE